MLLIGLNTGSISSILDPLLQSSELRRLMSEIRPAMERARYDKALSDDREYLGEKYLPVFMSDVINLLR